MNKPPIISEELQAKMDELLKYKSESPIVHNEFVYFKEKNAFHGSYFDHYAMATVYDSRKLPHILKPIIQILNESWERAVRTISCLPKSIRGTFNYRRMYNNKTKNSFTMCEHLKIPDWADLSHDDLSENYKFEMSSQELLEALNLMSVDSELYKEYMNNVLTEYDSVAMLDIHAYSCAERPFRLILSGNDDTAYYKSCSSLEEATEMINIMHKRGANDCHYDIIDELQLIMD